MTQFYVIIEMNDSLFTPSSSLSLFIYFAIRAQRNHYNVEIWQLANKIVLNKRKKFIKIARETFNTIKLVIGFYLSMPTKSDIELLKWIVNTQLNHSEVHSLWISSQSHNCIRYARRTIGFLSACLCMYIRVLYRCRVWVV